MNFLDKAIMKNRIIQSDEGMKKELHPLGEKISGSDRILLMCPVLILEYTERF